MSIVSISRNRLGSNAYHAFHLLKLSLWPLCVSLGIWSVVASLIGIFGSHVSVGLSDLLSCQVFVSIGVLCFFLYCWWMDVSIESGEHTSESTAGLKIGMCLFIISEVLFFFSFFFSFFYFSLSPGVELGNIWPPVGLYNIILDPTTIPLLNTFLLLVSGVFVTYTHHLFLEYFELEEGLVTLSKKNFIDTNSFKDMVLGLGANKVKSSLFFCRGLVGFVLTLFFAVSFIILQGAEYVEALFYMSDGAYGSSFFVMTGFHGLHVMVGTIFLIICFLRLKVEAFSYKISTGLECSIWYWHFVDVVWLFLVVVVYFWGGVSEFEGLDKGNEDGCGHPNETPEEKKRRIYVTELIADAARRNADGFWLFFSYPIDYTLRCIDYFRTVSPHKSESSIILVRKFMDENLLYYAMKIGEAHRAMSNEEIKRVGDYYLSSGSVIQGESEHMKHAGEGLCTCSESHTARLGCEKAFHDSFHRTVGHWVLTDLAKLSASTIEACRAEAELLLFRFKCLFGEEMGTLIFELSMNSVRNGRRCYFCNLRATAELLEHYRKPSGFKPGSKADYGVEGRMWFQNSASFFGHHLESFNTEISCILSIIVGVLAVLTILM
jgi:cytochrome c oxidase subunit 3